MDQQSEALAASMHAQLLDPNLLAQLNASTIPLARSGGALKGIRMPDIVLEEPLASPANREKAQLQVPGQHRAVHDERLGSPSKESGSLAKEKHSATEKRRRDRIAEGLAALKEVVIPGSAKEDQAGFLKNAANYIRHLQEALSYLQAMGAVQKLPEDVQWSIRAMLMRRLPNTALLRVSPPPASSAAAATADAALPQLLGFLLQQMSKDQGGQDGQQLQASMAQAALMHQMQTQYQSYIQQCVQAQQTPSPTPGQEQLQQLLQQQLQPPRQSTPSLPHSASSPILAPPEEQ